MARPKLGKRERKEESIRIRVSEEQKQLLTAAAKREGLDVSTWMRSLGLRTAAALRV
jgi:uncharacterized protein (DUF1778 family)